MIWQQLIYEIGYPSRHFNVRLSARSFGRLSKSSIFIKISSDFGAGPTLELTIIHFSESRGCP